MESSKQLTPGFIIIHLGAGYHSKLKLVQYRKLCKKACKEAMKLTKEGHLASFVTSKVVSLLERSDLTNAGFGSNLTDNGLIQCDAGLMDSDTGNFAAVACLEGVRCPITVAYELLMDQSGYYNGLEAPMVLAGHGAQRYALQKGIEVVDNEQLVSPEAFDTFKKSKAVINSHKYKSAKKNSLQQSRFKNESVNCDCKRKSTFQDSNEEIVKFKKPDTDVEKQTSEIEGRFDTVGAICIDLYGNVCTAVSSGGLILKRSGRVGQAACFGCGCYTSAKKTRERHVVCASSTSGCGEQLVKTMLAKSCVDGWLGLDDDYDDSKMAWHSNLLDNYFLKSDVLKRVEKKLAGCIAIKLTKNCTSASRTLHEDRNHSDEGASLCQENEIAYTEPAFSLDLLVTSTARTFCVGIMNMKEQKFQFLLLEMPDINKVGKSTVSQVFHYEW